MSTQAAGASLEVEQRPDPSFRFPESTGTAGFALQVEQTGLMRFPEDTTIAGFSLQVESVLPAQVRRRRTIFQTV